MNILICNDDGIDSEGIIVLATSLSMKHNVLVVAPDGNRSAFSHSLTINKEIAMREVRIDKAFKSYAISGTPADCVKFATYIFPDFKIDVVCSGINKGPNLGSDVVYSGTVAAGLEANALGLPAFAFSSAAYSDNMYLMCGVIALKIIDKFKENMSNRFTLNVNIPNSKEALKKPVKIAKLGIQAYADKYVISENGSYILVGEPIVCEHNDADCDVEWNRKNYVTVTPIALDKTEYSALASFEREVRL